MKVSDTSGADKPLKLAVTVLASSLLAADFLAGRESTTVELGQKKYDENRSRRAQKTLYSFYFVLFCVNLDLTVLAAWGFFPLSAVLHLLLKRATEEGGRRRRRWESQIIGRRRKSLSSPPPSPFYSPCLYWNPKEIQGERKSLVGNTAVFSHRTG